MVDLPPLYTRIEYTAASEYGSRAGADIDSFGIHHAVTTSLQAIIDLSKPGGREVSMTLAVKDHERVLVVPIESRPYTSASKFDLRSVTVEAANQTMAPDYLLSDATYDSLSIIGAHLARDYGVPLRIGVPGVYEHKNLYQWFEASYPTACAGPHFNTQRVINGSVAYLAGAASKPERRNTMTTLYVITKDDKRPAATTPASNFERWALAGDGRGDGAWLETADLNLANDWSVAHGRHVWLTKATYDSFRAAYTSGQPVSGGVGGGGSFDYDALAAAIVKAFPTTITGSLS